MSREENRNNNEENDINEPKNQDSVPDKAGTDAGADGAEKGSAASGEAGKAGAVPDEAESAAPVEGGTESDASGSAAKEGIASTDGEKPPAGADVESVYEADRADESSAAGNSAAGSGAEADGSPDSETDAGLGDKAKDTESDNLEDTIIAPSSRAGDSSASGQSKYGVSKRESVFATPAAVLAGETDDTEKIIGPDTTDKEATGNTAAETGEAREEDMASGKPKTREERRKEKEQQDGKKGKGKRKGRIRLIPVWLRLIIVLILFAASLVVGAMVGYGIIGEGNPMDIFEQETWLHIYDIIYEGTNLNGGGGE